MLKWLLCFFGIHDYQAKHERLPDTVSEIDMPDGSTYPLCTENIIIGACRCTRCGQSPRLYLERVR